MVIVPFEAKLIRTTQHPLGALDRRGCDVADGHHQLKSLAVRVETRNSSRRRAETAYLIVFALRRVEAA
jgi:uncharacterized protein (DUF1015 family)